MTSSRPRASLYVRLSNVATETNLSKAGMMSDLEQLADRLGVAVVTRHTDDGISGSVRNRPEFLAWLTDAVEGAADVLLAWSGDRITREGVNAAAMVLDVVEGKDPKTGKIIRPPVRFVSYDDRLDSATGEAFRWQFVIAAEVGRAERARMVSRNKNRVRRMKEQGRHVGQVPYGYRLDPDRSVGGILLIDEAEAQIVKDAARYVLAGTPVAQVARRLNHEGRLPRRRKAQRCEWVRTSLVQILTNPANAGEPLHPGAASRAPILTYSEVAELRRRLVGQLYTGKRGKRNSQAMLHDILLCHDCHRPMRSSSKRYVCMTAADGAQCGGAVSMLRHMAEATAERVYLARWGGMAEMRREVVLTGAAERDAIERETAEVMGKIAHSFTPELGARLGELQVHRANLDATPITSHVRRVATGRTLGDAWLANTDEDRRDKLKEVYEYIVCHPRHTRPSRLEFFERPEVTELSVDEFGDVQ